MAEITAALVKELREMTGLGMMECKKALQETGGDIGKAEEFLRIRSGAKASKAAARVAAEGVVGAFVSADGKLGALVEVNCETDFVARNEDFLAFSNGLAEIVAKERSGGRGGACRVPDRRREGRGQAAGPRPEDRREHFGAAVPPTGCHGINCAVPARGEDWRSGRF